MSGLCGWMGFDAERGEAARILEDMAAKVALHTNFETRHVIQPRAALASVSWGGQRPVQVEGDLVIGIVGEPWFSDADLARQAEERGIEAVLAELYTMRGPLLLDELHGAFALAILDPRAEEALLAIDRIGGRLPLQYQLEGGSLLFASTGDAIQAHPRGSSEIDPQAIYDYLFFHMVPAPETVRKGVRSLEPGSFLHLRKGQLRAERYWTPHYVEIEEVSLPELVREFRDLLQQSVARDAADVRCGSFLSGGTDSSTVAGMLRHAQGAAPTTYSIGFAAEGYDEMEYARIAAERFGATHRIHYATPEEVVELVPEVGRVYDEPFGNASAIPAHLCARMAAEDGMRRLLGGDGGDELFAGNERYATDRIFQAYDRVPGFLRRGLIEPLLLGFPKGDALPVLRRARSYLRQTRLSVPERQQSYNLLERLGAARVLDPEILASVDPGRPLAHLGALYDAADAETPLNRMLALDLPITLADNDLPKVSRMSELAGIEVAYPFLSDELVAFSLRLPSRLKLKGRRLRWFFKHALADFLPEEILTKPKQGFGLPFGVWTREHPGLRDLAHQSLNDLKRRGLVRPEFIDELWDLHQNVHAAYYGVMIWILMILEQWFQAHVDS